MITKIYGASNDLIEIEGAITDEANVYINNGEKVKFSISDGTNGHITYDTDANWRIEVLNKGSNYKDTIKALGDDYHHEEPALGCSSYSDVLLLEGEIKWVKIGKEKFN